MPAPDDWLAIGRSEDDEAIRERILTGYLAGKPFTPYVPTLSWPAGLQKVLDFGCGLGRNLPYLRTVAPEITGFDLPPMVERCRAACGGGYSLLTSDWDAIARQRYDLIVATLVLQHVDPAVCRARLEDFARIAPATYLLTRVMSDFGTNVLATVAETGLFDAGRCVEVDHDPATHQLRVLGERSFDELCTATDGGHYEVLLTSAPA